MSIVILGDYRRRDNDDELLKRPLLSEGCNLPTIASLQRTLQSKNNNPLT